MISYRLDRQKRKTISLLIKGGEVIVRAPMRVPLKTIDDFIARKSVWINKKLAADKRTSEFFADVLEHKTFMFCGKRLSPQFIDCKQVYISDETIFLPQKCRTSYMPLVRFYKHEAENVLRDELNRVANLLGLKFSSFSLSGTRGRWGSCTASKAISLNWRIIMLDWQLREYVIVHELCHLIELNHSKRFKALVAAQLPNYRQLEQKLKDCSKLLTELRF